MMPQLMHALADEHARELHRSTAGRIPRSSELQTHRPHRVAVRCGYWLISIGCRLVAPDLSTVAH